MNSGMPSVYERRSGSRVPLPAQAAPDSVRGASEQAELRGPGGPIRLSVWGSPTGNATDSSVMSVKPLCVTMKMPALDEESALTESIGLNGVAAIGARHLTDLSVVVNTADLTARVFISLARTTEYEQRRAAQNLLDTQDLFAKEVTMIFAFGLNAKILGTHSAGSRYYSYA